MFSSFQTVERVVYGRGVAAKLGDEVLRLGCRTVAVITDKGLVVAGIHTPLMASLKGAGVEALLYDQAELDPTPASIEKAAAWVRQNKVELLVGLGGGSALDSTKATALLAVHEGPMSRYFGLHKVPSACMPTILIPTTAGTGSEATPNAIVAVPEQELKVGIVSDAMIADNVLLDPLMIKNLPRKIAAATGVDALAHAIECYTSNKANPISDTFALEALDMILNNILPACDSADAVSQKSAMQLASFYAGVAITASGTTAVHALSYPLGGKYHIAHGVSNAILLAPVMRFNAPACPERFAAAYDRCVHGEKTCVTQEEKTEFMLRWLEKIVRHLEIPTSLSAFGVPASDLETLVAAGMQVTRLLNNNLRPVTADDARALYRRIL